jgi:phosphosulfolactate synthase (CoM biosynthesis protein A)
MVSEQSVGTERSIDERFSFMLDFENREEKPREKGITFIQGDGPFHSVTGATALENLLTYAGSWVDWYKFNFASIGYQPPDLVQEKLRLLDSHAVEAFTGGMFLEAAVADNVERRFFETLREVGVPRVEVSSSASDIGIERKAELIEQASKFGFNVHGEIGTKPSDKDAGLTTTEAIDEIRTYLDAGADKVIYESGELLEGVRAVTENDVALDDESADHLLDVTEAVGKENIVLEVPNTQEYRIVIATAWLVNNIGPDVNVGNATPNFLNQLELQRHYMGPYTFLKGPQ